MISKRTGEIAIEYVVGAIAVATGTAVGITMTMNLIPSGEPSSYSQLQASVRDAPRPVCSGYAWKETIDPTDFKQLLYASYTGNCEENFNTTVTLGFTLSNRTVDEYLSAIDITDSDGDVIAITTDTCDIEDGLEGVTFGKPVSDRIYYPEGTVINISHDGRSVRVCP